MWRFNRYKKIFTKVDARIFDSTLSHTFRSDASEKEEENTRVHFGANSPVHNFRVLACIGLGGVEKVVFSSPVSVNLIQAKKFGYFPNFKRAKTYLQ